MSDLRCAVCGAAVNENSRFCSSCGNKIAPPETPRAPSLSANVRHPLSARAKKFYFAGAGLLVAFFMYIFITHLPGGAHPVIERQPEIAMASANEGLSVTPQPVRAEVSGGTISISLTELLRYHAVAFEYAGPNGNVPLLAFITPEGKLVTSIRMCEPCNSKNFRIDGTELVCANCETRWKLSNLEGVQGTCQKYPPDPIPSTVDGNRIIIDEKLVKNWKMRI